MFGNYLTVAFRNLMRNRLYVLLNVAGLGIGLTLMVWGFQTWRFSKSWDNFHSGREQLFRVVVTRETNDALKGVCPLPLAEAVQKDFAGITASMRWDSRGCNIKANQAEPFSDQVHFTDPSFFELFNFPLTRGSNDLSDPNAIVITEKAATKYFGQNDPVGQTLLLYAGEAQSLPLTVKGVIKDLPLNSSFRFSLVTNLSNLKVSDTSYLKTDNWKWFLDAAVLRLQNPADAPQLEKAFLQYLPQQNAARPDWKITRFSLLPFTTMAETTAEMDANGLIEAPEASATYGPFIIAGLIFLSACLNFANTTVARSNRRLREMGVRKAMGGTRGQLQRQILLECGVVVFGALLFSISINNWWMDTFNSMFDGINVTADYLHDATLNYFLLGALLFTTLLAGAYPAFYISNFNATEIFRGGLKFGGNNLFSRILLGLQVVVSLMTVICGLAFMRNATFQKHYDYGYNHMDIMGLNLPDNKSYILLQNAVKDIPGVEKVAGSRHHIWYSYRTPVAESEGVKQEVDYFEVGEGYLDAMNLRLSSGRAPDPAREADYHDALLITQKAAAGFGWQEAEALNKQVRVDTNTYTVVGVLHDFHQGQLFNPMMPQLMRLTKPQNYNYLIIKANSEQLRAVNDQVKAKWGQLFPLTPYTGFFQDEVAAESFQVTSSIATLFSWFAVIAILMTATGLFALVSITVLKKMKEIALRKVAGARPLQILTIVNRGYLWIFGIASIVGGFGGWFLTRLLMDIIFKINPGVDINTLGLSVLALFAIALLTVGFKVRQAVNANPADVLRSE